MHSAKTTRAKVARYLEFMSNATFTSEGYKPHKYLKTIHGVIRCPVALITATDENTGQKRLVRDLQGFPYADRTPHGNLLYVLPGGGRTV